MNIPFNGGYTAIQRSLLVLTPDSVLKLRYLHSASDRKPRKRRRYEVFIIAGLVSYRVK
jgi:hypothetical protein